MSEETACEKKECLDEDVRTDDFIDVEGFLYVNSKGGMRATKSRCGPRTTRSGQRFRFVFRAVCLKARRSPFRSPYRKLFSELSQQTLMQMKGLGDGDSGGA